jgi:hypothetical protein
MGALNRVWTALSAAVQPRTLPGWTATRVGFAAAALGTWGLRGWYVPEAFSTAGIVISTGPFHFADHVMFTPATAWALYAVIIASLLAVAHGRFARPGIAAFLVCACLLMFEEALGTKAYDRLMFWQAVVLLLFAPGAGDGARVGSPAARYAMIVVYCGLYGATGWHKILDEPSWWNGRPLAHFLVMDTWGGYPLGVWLSSHPAPLLFASWWTLLFEASFPFLIWWKRTNPWLLLAGVCMHVGILLTLRVNTFSFVSIAAYPILLHPDVDVRALGDRISAWFRRAG